MFTQWRGDSDGGGGGGWIREPAVRDVPGPNYVAYVFVFLSSISVRLLYEGDPKSKVS